MIQQDRPSNIPLLADERLDTVNESIHLIQKKQGLTYGTDAFLLAAYIRPMPRARAVELGGGTGIASFLTAVRKKAAVIHAVEVQEAFAELIGQNAHINGLDGCVIPLCADLRDLNAASFDGKIELVFSNPPYMRCDSGKRNERDEKYIARHEVMGGIADFCDAAGRLLQTGGRFVTVWRPDRLTELLYALRDARLEPKRMTFVHADTDAEPCMVLTEAVKDAAPSLRMSAPLILYQPKCEEDRTRILTPEAQQIYDTCAFPC